MVSLYVAYKGGTFPELPAEMDRDKFIQAALERMAFWSDAIILEVKRPVGLVALQMLLNHVYVRVFWFPWASKRNKLETMLRFILDYRDGLHLIGATQDETFMSHLYRRGVARAIGQSHQFGGILYESIPSK